MQKTWEPIETAPRHEIEALQSYRLIRTVRRVYENVDFYYQKFNKLGILPKDIRGIEDLAKLPFTYKQDLRDNYPYGLFAVPQDEIVRIHASSGTTGKQTVVGYTQNDLVMWSDCAARCLVAAGATDKDFVHVAYGYGLFTGGLGLNAGAERMKATVIPVSTGNTKRQIQIMRDFKSSILCCTPSYALYLGESLREMDIDRSELSLRAGIFGAEPWTDQMREEIEKLLGIKAYDIYGLSEVVGPGVSFSCSENNGLHVNEDHFIVEVIDPDTGEVLPDGEQGELVFTAITKEALPLIRYRTRDIGSITHGTCGCGRTLVRMSKPRGRTDDMIIIRGVNVFPSQVESVLLGMGQSAPHYMLIVDRVNNLDTLEIQVEMSDYFFSDSIKGIESIERAIRSAVESTLGVSAKVTLVEPKSIARSEGKAVHVIDKRPK